MLSCYPAVCRLLSVEPWSSSREAVAHALMAALAAASAHANANTAGATGAAATTAAGSTAREAVKAVNVRRTLVACLNALSNQLTAAAYDQLLAKVPWTARV